MSLLMEALRKAEEAKRKIQNHSLDLAGNSSLESASQPEITPVPVTLAPSDTGFTLLDQEHDATADYTVDNFLREEKFSENGPAQNPAAAPRFTSHIPGRASVEELQNYLETTPELEETTPALSPDAPVKISPAAQQRAAGSVFAAKKKPTGPHTTRTLFLIMVAVIAVYAGWYLFYPGSSSLMIDPALINTDLANRSLSDERINYQPEPQHSEQNADPAIATINPGQIPIPATSPGIAVQAVAPAQQNAAPAAAISSGTETAGAALTPGPSIAAPLAGIASEPQTTNSETTTTPAFEENSNPNATAANNSETVLEVSHSKGTNNNNNQQLLDAYASLQTGDMTTASNLYRQVLEQFPNNRDALLGSAAVALRERNFSRAREFYSHLMQLNPKDPLARTGLLQTVQDIDPLQYEQELQRLLQQFPGVAPLSFALGNVYATQRKWNEAQSAYFDAFLFARRSNETSINPDYAYNLAVSLEQINQPAAALDYYRQAQTLAREVAPGFDLRALNRRISLLEQNRP